MKKFDYSEVRRKADMLRIATGKASAPEAKSKLAEKCMVS
jgi:hypothetical protein